MCCTLLVHHVPTHPALSSERASHAHVPDVREQMGELCQVFPDALWSLSERGFCSGSSTT